eukprot:TRINITY_DN35_c0_g1_i3.p1 TRINITY_DN35_c0_g1~~TRINITY_DN35_c0_g1_i3.p1  ORF type:complete len:236 (-),score=39.21 TRINITY_DN35_c0_g1_i3:54-698(-)
MFALVLLAASALAQTESPVPPTIPPFVGACAALNETSVCAPANAGNKFVMTWPIWLPTYVPWDALESGIASLAASINLADQFGFVQCGNQALRTLCVSTYPKCDDTADPPLPAYACRSGCDDMNTLCAAAYAVAGQPPQVCDDTARNVPFAQYPRYADTEFDYGNNWRTVPCVDVDTIPGPATQTASPSDTDSAVASAPVALFALLAALAAFAL